MADIRPSVLVPDPVREYYIPTVRVRCFVVDSDVMLSLLRGEIAAWRRDDIPPDAVIQTIIPEPEFMRFRIYIHSPSYPPVNPDSLAAGRSLIFGTVAASENQSSS